MVVTYATATGAFYGTAKGNQASRAFAQGGTSFDASLYSSVYVDNAHVKPNSYSCKYYIRF